MSNHTMRNFLPRAAKAFTAEQRAEVDRCIDMGYGVADLTIYPDRIRIVFVNVNNPASRHGFIIWNDGASAPSSL